MGALVHFIPLGALVLYSIATILYLRLLSAESTVSTVSCRGFLLGGFLLHALFLGLSYVDVSFGASPKALSLASFPYALSKVACLLIGVFLLIERVTKASVLGAFVAPLGVLFMLFSSVLLHISETGTTIEPVGPLLSVHLIAVIIAIALFVLAFGVSLAVIFQESMMKRKRFTSLQRRLPSLNMLDRLNFGLLTVGFFLMALGISAGFLFAYLENIDLWQFDSRLVWSLLTLLIYAVLVLARTQHGWRGRRAAWLAVAGFSTLVASFLGVNLMDGSFHVY